MKKIYFLMISLLMGISMVNAQTLINSNGDFETGDATNWTFPGGGTGYEISATVAHSGSYGLHVNITEGLRLDGLITKGFQFEIGQTYTFEMRVKAITMNQNITVRMQPEAGWSDAFKQNLTLPGTGWGVNAEIGEWVHFTFTKEITTSFSAESVVGDMIDSKIHFQCANASPTATEIYIDDVKIYKGTYTDLKTNTEVPTPTVYVSNNTLYLTELESSSTLYKIYNLSGAIVAEGEFSGSSYSKSLNLNEGLYIVKTGSTTTKIMIK